MKRRWDSRGSRSYRCPQTCVLRAVLVGGTILLALMLCNPSIFAYYLYDESSEYALTST